jgi:hypothetical protein
MREEKCDMQETGSKMKDEKRETKDKISGQV